MKPCDKAAGVDTRQRGENDRLHVELVWEYPDGRRVEERSVLRQKPELVQESWSVEERVAGQVVRRIDVDFAKRHASGLKVKDGKQKTWSQQIDVTDGRTFAGFGVGWRR